MAAFVIAGIFAYKKVKEKRDAKREKKQKQYEERYMQLQREHTEYEERFAQKQRDRESQSSQGQNPFYNSESGNDRNSSSESLSHEAGSNDPTRKVDGLVHRRSRSKGEG